MARVYVELEASFDCQYCGEESKTDPNTSPGKTVVCANCGKSQRVGDVGYPVRDWNKLNREQAKRRRK